MELATSIFLQEGQLSRSRRPRYSGGVRRDKLLEKLKNQPNNVTFGDVRKLLETEGFILDRISGSHHIFCKGSIIFAIPTHRNRVKVVYVKRVIEIIEEHGKP